MRESNDKGIKSLLDLMKELQSMNGRTIQETTFPMHSVISKTPKTSEERAAYEKFLKDSKIAEDNIGIIGEHFLGDMIKKHLG